MGNPPFGFGILAQLDVLSILELHILVGLPQFGDNRHKIIKNPKS
jgi:hypothetical protein